MPPTKDDDEDAEKTGIYAEYFRLTNEYREKYGEQMILLMQVGSFFEVYGMKNTENSIVSGSAIVPFAQMCQLVVTEKTSQYQNSPIVMAGFRDYALEKYLQKITDNGYTSVVYIQEKVGKKVKRVFHSVHSPGTYVPYENEMSVQTSNNIMCIWFEQYTSPVIKKLQVACGIAICNIFTGKSSIFEYSTAWMLNPTTFDEVERCLATHCPSEVIVIYPFEENTLQTVLQYSGISRVPLIHKFSMQHETAKRCSTQKYINLILSTHFGEESYTICEEFSINTIATQAFCYLLHFVQEHNPNLVRKIGIPEFDGMTDSRVLLVNHTLKQLNIIDDSSTDGRRAGKYSSVLTLLNKCSTAMGRRKLQSQLLMPSYNEIWLNTEYSMIDHMISKDKEMIIALRKVLREIADIEKVSRQIVLRRIYPSTMYNLFKSVDCIQQLNLCLYESPELCVYLGQTADYVNDKCTEMHEYIEKTLIIKECAGLNSLNTFAECIIQRGISPELDAFMNDKTEKWQIYAGIRDGLNRLIQKHTKSLTDVDYVKEHETDKLGLSLQITSKRGQMLKTALEWLKTQSNPHIDILVGDEMIQVHARDIKITKATTSNDVIECPLLTKTTREILQLKENMNQTISRIFMDFVIAFEEKWLTVLEELAEYVSKMDVLFCKVYIAQKYDYCRPFIDEEDCKSYVDASRVRHPLIEHIQQNEVYVSNDISLGKEGQYGILLYGTNAVGKTSMIRSVGIAIIMAQAGMYVPCGSMKYKPYRSIFSRILGNDNLFKGLSTFVVEMSELRTILKMADEYSLILGDELCSGTESESGITIVMSGLLEIEKKGSSYMLATHMHELVNKEEIIQMKHMKMYHLSVYYDRELDALVYDRKMKEGSGTKMYGLEVCKSLYMPEDFMNVAYELRNKYYPETRGLLKAESSRYNANKMRVACEICKNQIGEEVHHINAQKNANERGYIDGVSKNHVGNLLSICEECHNALHNGNKKSKSNGKEEERKCKKKSSVGYVWL